MQGMGYVNNSKLVDGKFTEIDVTLFTWDFALKIRSLVAILFLVAGVMLFIGLGLIYNLDKKTLAKMNADLGRDVEADDDLTYTTAEDTNDLA
jgi:hypothetical protein